MTALPTIGTSERSLFRRCPQAWWWRYRDGLSLSGDKADALWFGTGIHIALAEWYGQERKRGKHPADTFKRWCGNEIREVRAARDSEFDDVKWEDAAELGEDMLEGYVREYGKDEQWDVIAVEQPFRIKVLRGGKPIAISASTFDGVVRDASDSNRCYLLEHKTASQIQLPYLELDDQAGLYWAVATAVLRAKGILEPDEEISGIIYNFLRKSKTDERERDELGNYLNQDGSISKRQPAAKFVRHYVERLPNEQRTQMERLADEVTWMNAVRNGSMPLIKNTTKECTFCDFFEMCKMHERRGHWEALRESLYVVENPYLRVNQKSAAV